MNLNIWVKRKTTLFVGGDPSKGQAPVVTTELENPQLLIDTDKGIITIIETSGKVVKK